MKAVTLEYRIENSLGVSIEHRCGKDAGYDLKFAGEAYDVTSIPIFARIWGNQGTFIVPVESIVSLSFQENIDECPVCS